MIIFLMTQENNKMKSFFPGCFDDFLINARNWYLFPTKRVNKEKNEIKSRRPPYYFLCDPKYDLSRNISTKVFKKFKLLWRCDIPNELNIGRNFRINRHKKHESNTKHWSMSEETDEVFKINEALPHSATVSADNTTLKTIMTLHVQKRKKELMFEKKSFSHTK